MSYFSNGTVLKCMKQGFFFLIYINNLHTHVNSIKFLVSIDNAKIYCSLRILISLPYLKIAIL